MEIQRVTRYLDTAMVEESELVSNIRQLESNKLNIGAAAEALERLNDVEN